MWWSTVAAVAWSADGAAPGATPAAAAPAPRVTSPTVGALIWVPPGRFTMGSPATEAGRGDDEGAHEVTLTRGFYLMEHEVTQGEWQAVMGNNPSSTPACGPTCPVTQVPWTDAVAFAERLSKKEGMTYRLPTEAEWEYAARAGGRTRYAGGDEPTAVGWMETNSGWSTHPVCGLQRNAWGFCDLTGNVTEWVSDWYGPYGGAATDPAGPPDGSFRVFRGGGSNGTATEVRVAERDGGDPRAVGLGFRLARVP
jgi:formylglycine-generating enzyme required for sulfatase activity